MAGTIIAVGKNENGDFVYEKDGRRFVVPAEIAIPGMPSWQQKGFRDQDAYMKALQNAEGEVLARRDTTSRRTPAPVRWQQTGFRSEDAYLRYLQGEEGEALARRDDRRAPIIPPAPPAPLTPAQDVPRGTPVQARRAPVDALGAAFTVNERARTAPAAPAAALGAAFAHGARRGPITWDNVFGKSR